MGRFILIVLHSLFVISNIFSQSRLTDSQLQKLAYKLIKEIGSDSPVNTGGLNFYVDDIKGYPRAKGIIEEAISDYSIKNHKKIRKGKYPNVTISIRRGSEIKEIIERVKKQLTALYAGDNLKQISSKQLTHIISGYFYKKDNIFYLQALNLEGGIVAMASNQHKKNVSKIKAFDIRFSKMAKNDAIITRRESRKLKNGRITPYKVGVVVVKGSPQYHRTVPVKVLEHQYKLLLFKALKYYKIQNLNLLSFGEEDIKDIINEKKFNLQFGDTENDTYLTTEDLIFKVEISDSRGLNFSLNNFQFEKLFVNSQKIRKRTLIFGITAGYIYIPLFDLPLNDNISQTPVSIRNTYYAGISVPLSDWLQLGMAYTQADITLIEPNFSERLRGGRITLGGYNARVNPFISAYLAANTFQVSEILADRPNITTLAGASFGFDIGKQNIKLSVAANYSIFNTSVSLGNERLLNIGFLNNQANDNGLNNGTYGFNTGLKFYLGRGRLR